MSHAAELSIVVVATNLLQVSACVESLAACAALDRAQIVLVGTSMSWPWRCLVGSSDIALPIVRLGRFAARAAVRPRYWIRALTALPFALLFAGAETLGEIEGYFGSRV